MLHFDFIRQGGPTRTSADASVPRPRTHDDRTGRVFPDHLITAYYLYHCAVCGPTFGSIRPGGRRTDKNICRVFGAPACRGFFLIT
jgi:hypothetical protein